jgi:lysine-N-methylase
VAHLGPRYYARFSCLAEKCEDTCCRDFRIAVDEPHYHAMAEAFAKAGEPERFAAAFAPTGKPQPFALVVHADGGGCRMLEGGLCTVHARFGGEVLGNACNNYPRLQSELGADVELSTELSCPEAARQCLLGEDAMEIVPLSQAVAPRHTVKQRLPAEVGASPWLRHFPEIRGAMLRLLGESRHSIETRLFFVAYLAYTLDALVRPESAEVDGGKLAAALALVDRAESRAELARKLKETPVGRSPSATILTVVLSARLQSPAPPAFRALVGAIAAADLTAVGETPSGDPARDLYTLGPARLDAQHRVRDAQHRVRDARGAELDRYLERYCQHHLYTDWHLNAASLLAHVQLLIVRVAIIRWLTLGGFAVRQNAAPDALSRAVVEAVYSFSRTIEHNTLLTEGMAQALERSRMLTLAHSVALLKF